MAPNVAGSKGRAFISCGYAYCRGSLAGAWQGGGGRGGWVRIAANGEREVEQEYHVIHRTPPRAKKSQKYF